MTFQLTIKTAADLEAEAQAALKAEITRAIDKHVEDRARALEYNGAAHLASYVSSAVPEWAAEAQAFVAWRDAVWTEALSLLAAHQHSGDLPSVAGVIAALPEWPS